MIYKFALRQEPKVVRLRVFQVAAQKYIVLLGLKVSSLSDSFTLFCIEKLADGNVITKKIFTNSLSKIKGFGDSVVLESTDHTVKLLLVTGLGIGAFHVITLSIDMDQSKGFLRLLGSINSRTNTIRSLVLGNDKTVYVGSLTSNDIESYCLCLGAHENIVLNASETKKTFIYISCSTSSVDMRVAKCLRETATYGTTATEQLNKESDTSDSNLKLELFPRRLFNELEYDGEVNVFGVAHGYGEKSEEDDPRYLYVGNWLNGKKHGKGKIIHEESGEIWLIGNFKDGKADGFCVRYEGKEVFQGFFVNDLEHGIGRSYTTEHNKNSFYEYIGFYKEGKMHGIGYQTFGRGSKKLPVRGHVHQADYLCPLRSLRHDQKGKFFDEFNFHRLDMINITDMEKDIIFNDVKFDRFLDTTQDSFYGLKTQHCWACLKHTPEELVLCSTPNCGFKFHFSCSKLGLKQYSWDSLVAHATSLGKVSLEESNSWTCPAHNKYECARVEHDKDIFNLINSTPIELKNTQGKEVNKFVETVLKDKALALETWKENNLEASLPWSYLDYYNKTELATNLDEVLEVLEKDSSITFITR